MEKRKFFFFGVLIGLVLLGAWVRSQPDGRLHLVFCDVGQGDAIYIKFPDGRDGLIDGGPNRTVLNCLGKHMAFWDRKLELVILTHPQADHLNGLIDVFERYQVDLFLAPPVGNETVGYQRLVDLVKEKGIKVRNVYAGDKINIKSQKSNIKNTPNQKHSFGSGQADKNSKSQLPITTPNQSKLGSGQDYQLRHEVALNVVWPEREWVFARVRGEEYVYNKQAIASQLQRYNVLGAKTWHSDLNDFSLVLEVSFGEFEALLTGDAEAEILERALMGDRGETRQIEILKIPHHGSAGAASVQLLEKLKPALAVISVGKNNRYGHPNNKILEILRDYPPNRRAGDIKILRTDVDGEVEIVTDGKRWWQPQKAGPFMRNP